MNNANAYQERLSAFFGVLAQKLRSHHDAVRRLDRFLSTRFNVFTLIKPDENRLSDIIANLLDPKGSHGQKPLFLDSFLDLVGLRELRLSTPPMIVREDPTRYIRASARRIDVTVDFGHFGLGIENKPWAGDQQDQLMAYHEHLILKYSGRFCLVYITPAGNRPFSMPHKVVERELQQKRLRLLSYASDVLSWLEEPAISCSSDKFRWFLRDFTDYIRESFPVSPTIEVIDGSQ
jgi:PD-(D/E)XK nuclease superfamily protein